VLIVNELDMMKSIQSGVGMLDQGQQQSLTFLGPSPNRQGGGRSRRETVNFKIGVVLKIEFNSIRFKKRYKAGCMNIRGVQIVLDTVEPFCV
jgi:hypothetical protein